MLLSQNISLRSTGSRFAYRLSFSQSLSNGRVLDMLPDDIRGLMSCCIPIFLYFCQPPTKCIIVTEIFE